MMEENILVFMLGHHLVCLLLSWVLMCFLYDGRQAVSSKCNDFCVCI